jgi:tetraacyldisaccharide 4'-kinase
VRTFYLDLISGKRRGPIAFLLRLLLSFASIPYAVVHGTRRLFYQIGLFKSVRLPVPVISVGNITAGGTGKTPIVEYLARWFARKNLRTVILARGYQKIDESGRDDEDLFAEMDIEGVVRLAGKDRVALARRAMQDLKPDVFILDDGFQHYRIQRDLEIVAIDTTNPFAGGRLIPRGLLRESPSNLRRADIIALTRCNQAEPQDLYELRERVDRISEGVQIVETCHKPVCVRNLTSKTRKSLDWLKGKAFHAICGIGNPDSFRRTIESLGAKLPKFRAFGDHHLYTAQDLQQVNATAQEFMVKGILTTEKDSLKLNPEAFDLPLLALTVEIEARRGEDIIDARLRSLIREHIKVAGAATTP